MNGDVLVLADSMDCNLFCFVVYGFFESVCSGNKALFVVLVVTGIGLSLMCRSFFCGSFLLWVERQGCSGSFDVFVVMLGEDPELLQGPLACASTTSMPSFRSLTYSIRTNGGLDC